MKFAIVLPDGAADEPIPELDGKTALEAARIPNMDWIAATGRSGLVKTVPDGFTPGSDVATLSVIGYDVKTHYTGRAPLEAVANRIPVGADDMVFRCNLVTIVDGRMEDFSAGHISQAEATQIINDLQAAMGNDRISFHVGVGYRHLMVVKGGISMKAKCQPPHDIPGQPVSGYLPGGKDGDELRALIARSQEILATHEVNNVRRDLGENPATSIWLWGQGRPPQLPTLKERFGLTGAVISAVDLIRGIGLYAGLEPIIVPGATGYLDTNYAGKVAAALEALKSLDLVFIHVEAPDEASHEGSLARKIEAIERFDADLLAPFLAGMEKRGPFRALIMPDHYTPLEARTHTREPVPFLIYDSRRAEGGAAGFSERNAARGRWRDIPGPQAIEILLERA